MQCILCVPYLCTLRCYQVLSSQSYQCFITFKTEVLYFLGSQVLAKQILLLCGLISWVFYQINKSIP